MKKNVLTLIRESRSAKFFAAFVSMNMIFQLISPTVSFALTSGPSQPEFASFEPASTSDMVDLYSGDFNYNIPLLTVPGPNGGYPINIAYHSGVGMEEEASWVGLGWTLNVGAINRQLRGLPDDFKGDNVTQIYKHSPNWTAGIDLFGGKEEHFGLPTSGGDFSRLQLQVYYNNYKGLGYRLSTSVGIVKTAPVNVGVGLSFDSQNGIGVEPDLTLKGPVFLKHLPFTAGIGYNSRQGIEDYTFSSSITGTKKKNPNRTVTAHSSSISFSTQQSIPAVTLPMKNLTWSFDVGISPSVGYGFHDFRSAWPQYWSGFLNTSEIDGSQGRGSESRNAYGYLNTNLSDPESMQDFQRQSLPYSKKVPNLPSSSYNYDLFTQSGQGTGGMFRAYSNVIGIIADPKRTNDDRNVRLNVEYGSGVGFHVGLGVTIGSGTNSTGYWERVGSNSDLAFDDITNFNTYGYADDEQKYMQVYGEKTGELLGDDQLQSWKEDEAVRANIVKENDDDTWRNSQFVAENEFVTGATDGSPVPASTSNNHKKKRNSRPTNIQYLSSLEASKYGMTRYTGNTFTSPTAYYATPKAFYTTGDKSNHISEISVLQPGGMRYTYGLPAYNTMQKDLTFSVLKSGGTINDDLTVSTSEFDYNGAATEVNPKGRDKFLLQTELPEYVHSWMLSSAVSSDYVDLTKNGPTDDDYGYWAKFNYVQKNTAGSPYKWRIPYQDAIYSHGYENDPTDDRGSIVYGEKEIYYVQSIETKTHVAVFHISARKDGLDADGFDASGSAKGTETSYKLDSISLYSKKDYFTSASVANPDAVPIKRIHFRYSYNLCGNVKNNNGAAVDYKGGNPGSSGLTNVNAKSGKLTLDTLYFSYQTCYKGRLSPYVFDYGNISSAANNPDYNRRNMDRWGNFKDNPTGGGNTYPFIEFPYTDQAAPGDAVWTLKQITLPTNGILKVNYEPDDYAYVENQKAARMFDIIGLGSGFNTNSTRANTTIYTDNTEVQYGSTPGAYRVYFRLERPLASSTADSIKIYYLRGLKDSKIYFKTYTELIPGFKDYVSGYADVDTVSANSYGVATETVSNDVGYITLKPVKLQQLSNRDASPLTRAGIEHLHVNRSELLFAPVPYDIHPLSQVINVANSLTTFFGDLAQCFEGFNRYAADHGYAQNIDLNGRSVIRLLDPNSKKSGGGVRVKELSLNDSWYNTAVTDSISYGQYYDYTTKINGKTISSGVAYEPNTGQDESALRTPVDYIYSSPLSSKEHLFVENPVLENYYPGPSVGYSKVTVRSIAPKEADKADDGNGSNNSNTLANSTAPISIYEFYTPKDFPVITDQTDMSSNPSIIRPIMIPGIYSTFKKRKARSQGYSVVLNDMAGKPKSVTLKTVPTGANPEGTLLSRQEYVYQTAHPYDPSQINQLSSKVQVITEDGTYQTGVVGQSHDFFIDVNENRQENKTRGLDVNLEYDGSLPIIIPLPNLSDMDASLRTIVTHKIIYRTGILKQVIATTNESVVKTENLAFDLETGEPILTKVTNEFEDPIFNYSFPSHWYYPGMAGASKNTGVLIDRDDPVGGIGQSRLTASSGRVVITTYIAGKKARDLFELGDEVWVDYNSGTDQLYTVVKISPNASGSQYIDLIDQSGVLIANTTTNIESIKIIRSGHRNMQNVDAGTLTYKTMSGFVGYDPQDAGTLKSSPTSFTQTDILDASATEFSDVWQLYCLNCSYMNPDDSWNDLSHEGTIINPYTVGIKGVWRPYKNYAFKIDRLKSGLTQTDGTYSSFSKFDWLDPASSDAKWIRANTMTKYSPYGFEVENKDAIGVYSAATFDYNYSVPTIVAKNAKYKEIAFDGFEDYSTLPPCTSTVDVSHFKFYLDAANISDDYAHTGKYSMSVPTSSSIYVTKNIFLRDCETELDDVRHAENDSTAGTVERETDSCDCMGSFSPLRSKKYVISAWVNEPGADAPLVTDVTYTSPQVKVELLNVGGSPIGGYTVTLSASDKIIEGWQRVYGTFEVPAAARAVRVTLINSSSPRTVYFDDVRIHPFTGNMISYVYDNVSLRLLAELDANNYATFYIYDDEGKLSKVKKETTEGIKTIKEGRTNNRPR